MAENNSLFIEQIGDGSISQVQQAGFNNNGSVSQATSGVIGNRAMLVQGSVPTAAEAADVLDLDPAASVFAFGGPNGTVNRSLEDMLASVSGGAGQDNTASIVQQGADNRTLALQVGGDGNRLLTEQFGNANTGIHLQEGHRNDTALIQENGGNTNALVARGDVVANNGGPFTLHATGNVDGFSVEATGPQPYSRITVQPNGTGGFNIRMDR